MLEVGSMTRALRPGRLLRVTLVLACGACASGGAAVRVADVTPRSIPSLEAQKSQHPQDANTLARLGVAYFKAGRYEDARPVLDSALAHDATNGVAAIYLGMTAEQLGDFVTARTAYEQYIAVSRNPDLKAAARDRLALVGRRQLEYQARQALAHEATLAQMPPESNTVAVMPFSYVGSNPDIQPLTRGLAQLLVIDLAKSRQIRVLERDRMQAILNEMQLSDSGYADPTTALRSGHLLRAAEVVQGSITGLPGDQLRVDAAVVNVANAGVTAAAGNQDQIGRLFDLEKTLAFRIFSSLGIQLSPAEQQAISQRPTQNVQAFLAYSRGLVAQDSGDYGAAQADFNQAAVLDPGFQAAVRGAASAGQLSAASQVSVNQMETTVSRTETLQAPANTSLADAQQSALNAATNTIAPSSGAQVAGDLGGQASQPVNNRNPVSESQNSEGAQQPGGGLIIIIRRPP
jgi:tetratricopeptide (TPR) repeat protein